jgi:hypothetical protein
VATGRSRTALFFARVPASWIIALGTLGAALTGRSGPVMGLALAFQLCVAPLLAQLEVLGDARLAIPAVAISRFDGPEGLVGALPVAGAIAIILAWAAAGLCAGLYRTRTAEI